MSNNNKRRLNLSPLTIAVIYGVVTGLWIAFTDRLLQSWISDPQLLYRLQTYKGWFYVFVTSVGLYLLIKKYSSQIKASETSSKRSDKLLRKVFDSLLESVIIVDPENRHIIDCNTATQKIFGYEPEELIGRSTRHLHLDESHYKKFDEIGRKALSEDGTFQTEFKMEKKKRGTISFRSHRNVCV